MYHVGESYLGRQIWAMDLTSPVAASHWLPVKATTSTPTVIYSAQEDANEVSSNSHVLRHAELLLTDSAQRAKLEGSTWSSIPSLHFTNPDGAQLAYDLYRITPDYILHAGLERTGSAFRGGATLRMDRARPPVEQRRTRGRGVRQPDDATGALTDFRSDRPRASPGSLTRRRGRDSVRRSGWPSSRRPPGRPGPPWDGARARHHGIAFRAAFTSP